MLRAGNISVMIRGKQILQDVSVQVLPGRFTAVVGPNGAGKSTLIKVLAGEISSTEGSIQINANEAASMSPKAMSLVRAVLPQHTQVHFAFTAEQVVLLGRQAHAATKNENSAVVGEVMELTGTSAFRSRIYHTLSGGEKQRVQLARVLAQVWEQTLYPRYLLLDEPTSSLDIAQQDIIFSLARLACTRNIGVLAIIHDLNQAVQFADEMVFLKCGRCVCAGAPPIVFTQSNIETTFGCPVNLYHLAGRSHPFMVPSHNPLADAPSFQPCIQFNNNVINQ
ncbi:heme ABC transporter ATP-binding protein [Chryseolinea sp. T2]|uniref:heme ABC transporter ATP-binding protein n=1 Tax=Chryseolinea sp. T2 TaxID=3129255 RepID=UPI003076BF1F